MCRRSDRLEDLTLLLPSDVVDHVLCWLHDQEEGIDPLRLEALVSLYGLSARSYGIQLPPSYDTLLLRCINSQVCLHVLLGAGPLLVYCHNSCSCPCKQLQSSTTECQQSVTCQQVCCIL